MTPNSRTIKVRQLGSGFRYAFPLSVDDIKKPGEQLFGDIARHVIRFVGEHGGFDVVFTHFLEQLYDAGVGLYVFCGITFI